MDRLYQDPMFFRHYGAPCRKVCSLKAVTRPTSETSFATIEVFFLGRKTLMGRFDIIVSIHRLERWF
jgi:hypothetical protein